MKLELMKYISNKDSYVIHVDQKLVWFILAKHIRPQTTKIASSIWALQSN